MRDGNRPGSWLIDALLLAFVTGFLLGVIVCLFATQ